MLQGLDMVCTVYRYSVPTRVRSIIILILVLYTARSLYTPQVHEHSYHTITQISTLGFTFEALKERNASKKGNLR